MRWLRLRAKYILALVTMIGCCVLAEVGMQLRECFRTPMCVRLDDRRLYGLNPAYPEISSQGFRNVEVVSPKPPGVYRVAILGDSIPYGVGVTRAQAFPQLMHGILGEAARHVEVINCGVPGYSPYNEVEMYRSAVARLEPDLVILSICRNDVVNPRLHWSTAGYALGAPSSIPDEAIPDLDDDRLRVLPMLAAANEVTASRDFVTRSMLLTAAFDGLLTLCTPKWNGVVPAVPTYLAFEDPTSIEVLSDAQSPQSEWLLKRLVEVRDAVVGDGRKLIVVFFPLAYEMEPGYPHSPELRMTDSCHGNAIVSLNMLPVLLGHTKAQMYRLATGDFYDVWHLTPAGHQVIAEALSMEVVAGIAQSGATPAERARQLFKP